MLLFDIFLQKIDEICPLLLLNYPKFNSKNKSSNIGTGGCYPLLKIEGWISTPATRSYLGLEHFKHFKVFAQDFIKNCYPGISQLRLSLWYYTIQKCTEKHIIKVPLHFIQPICERIHLESKILIFRNNGFVHTYHFC